MYIVNLIYKKDIKEVDELREAHLNWVQENYQNGKFVASGAKVPQTGGIILVKSMPRYELDDLLATDPFEKVVDYVVTEVEIKNTSPEFEGLKGL
ncbi:hypothetical protein GKC56_07240 [Neisseriaceae bacterium PsAf]|nr:hypothetical protein [Neisseriaceae bacterium PsAf]MCV2502904.1 YciI family protein [Neisseriaceae bacterium]